jgi:hypothetical protein
MAKHLRKVMAKLNARRKACIDDRKDAAKRVGLASAEKGLRLPGSMKP